MERKVRIACPKCGYVKKFFYEEGKPDILMCKRCRNIFDIADSAQVPSKVKIRTKSGFSEILNELVVLDEEDNVKEKYKANFKDRKFKDRLKVTI